jgi:hypothetical protein
MRHLGRAWRIAVAGADDLVAFHRARIRVQHKVRSYRQTGRR